MYKRVHVPHLGGNVTRLPARGQSFGCSPAMGCQSCRAYAESTHLYLYLLPGAVHARGKGISRFASGNCILQPLALLHARLTLRLLLAVRVGHGVERQGWVVGRRLQWSPEGAGDGRYQPQVCKIDLRTSTGPRVLPKRRHALSVGFLKCCSSLEDPCPHSRVPWKQTLCDLTALPYCCKPKRQVRCVSHSCQDSMRDK